MDERAGPVDHLGELEPGEGRALRRQLPQRLRRHLAREASLEADQAREVGGEDGALEVALHEDDHRLAAELLAKALGGLEGRRVAAHQRVGGGARLEPQGQDEPDERQRAHDRDGRQRALNHEPRDAAE